MNKKSAILLFSVLFLLSLGILYVMADLSTLAITKSGDGFDVSEWITNIPTQVNLTVTTTGGYNITNITFTLPEANVTWEAIVPGVGGSENISGTLTNITYYTGGSAWNQWTCSNISDDSSGQINCYVADTDQGLGGLGGNVSLVLTLNVTGGNSVWEATNVNFTVQLTNESSNNITSATLGVDQISPRLIEVNISDGNTTYHNSTWGTQYFLNGPLYIEALIEDSQLGNAIVLGYLCNSSNASVASEGIGSSTEEVLAVTNEAVGTLNQKGRVTSSRIVCSEEQVGGNETFNFVFLANDSFNHRIQLNGTGTLADVTGSFNIWLDDGELTPVIAKVNVTQTTITGSDGVTTVSKTLNHGSELDGTSDYLAANTVTFDIELTGGYKPESVMIVWNDSEPSTVRLTPVIGGVWDVTGVDLSAALNATNITNGAGWAAGGEDLTITNTTTVIYSQTLNLVGNDTNQFVFWVYANNTGANYTRLSGPHRFIVDGAAASLTMTPPTDRTITPRASITYKCTMSDAASGNSKIMWQLKKPGETAFTTKQNYADVLSGADSITFTEDDTNLAGDYDVRCIAIDAVGNEGTYTSSSSETFSVHYSTAEGGAAEGGAAADIDLSTTEELTITEKQGVISTFTLDGVTIHTLKIKKVDEVAGTVTILIESDPIEITLKIGETKEVDIDADGANDISVTLNKIIDGVADITTKRLTPLPEEKPTEEVPPTEKPAEEIPTAPEAASKTWLWILIIVIIVVIGVGYWFMKRK